MPQLTCRIGVATALLLWLAGCGDEARVEPQPDAPANDVEVAADTPDVSAPPELPESTDSLETESEIEIEDDAPEPPSEIAVGLLQTTIDGTDGVSLPLMVWYPAHAPKQDAEPMNYLGLLTGVAYPELKAIDGFFPVVLFSHGSQAINFQSVDVCEAWARAGYIVAAPNHVGNTLLDNAKDDETKGQVGKRRPFDLAATLLALQAFNTEDGHLLTGRIDTQRVGVAGHSFGGMTALVAAGASVDVELAQSLCDAGQDMKGACALVKQMEGPLYDGRPPELETIKAAISLSPALWGLFGEKGLATTTAPVFIAAGDKDTITDTAAHALPIYAHLPTDKALARFPDAGHYAFSNFCDIPDIESISGGVIAECDDNFIDNHVAMAIIAELGLMWLDFYVKGDATALDAFTQQTVDEKWPGLLGLERSP